MLASIKLKMSCTVDGGLVFMQMVKCYSFCKYMYMMLDSKIQEIKNRKHIQVPGDSNKWGPTVYSSRAMLSGYTM